MAVYSPSIALPHCEILLSPLNYSRYHCITSSIMEWRIGKCWWSKRLSRKHTWWIIKNAKRNRNVDYSRGSCTTGFGADTRNSKVTSRYKYLCGIPSAMKKTERERERKRERGERKRRKREREREREREK